jgi:hypothetical protein
MRERRRQPSGQQQIGQADSVIRMVVGEENDIDSGERDVKLEKPRGCTAADIDQKLLVAGFDQDARTEAIWAGIGRAAAQQGHTESGVLCVHPRRTGKAKTEVRTGATALSIISPA